ncbi:FadR family transcriptional regulator [Frankia sp. CNm7]|uniref:FadR family transcriptional regulator n=1 Tax=Frankia nepalensis TaxID=1836974 RepID=A0A937UMP1_9ACTN|nr:GntR family transcriptional regulator [Frankia nepalensis]MBL7494953.1 FadR family transcriptional regulator [Frankia nepalensis]MBL7513655.1 FadR family transcriptional regulator [Frankia nepalensis]MBL7524290.1 FadR family transcriptional regulator [Frankia nepalensis]MBL7627268.1 FadR family transcriptional regulator [Frankia nepalensis]
MTASAAAPGRVTAADTFRPPAPHKIAHVLAADLRRQILRGTLQVDQQLPPEAELMVAFDVSRDTLRETLRILEAQSLLDIRRGRGGGAVVRRPGLSSASSYIALLLQLRGTTIGHLEEARSVLEPAAAEQVALRLGEEGLDHLVALHDNERAAEGDPLAFVTAVSTFDQAVTELSGNRSIAVITGILRVIHAGQVYAAIDTLGPPSAERIARRVAAAHGEFLAAARRRDGAAAREAWSSYLLTSARQLAGRGRGRQPIDVAPLWRARAGRAPEAAGRPGASGGAGGSVVDGGFGAAGAPPRRMASAVAGEIRARIAEGRLADGDRLPSLADLATEFGVSRPTLREALRILEMESLLQLRAGDRAGGQIRHPSTQVAAHLAGTVLEARQVTLADFFQAVRLFEPAMMELTAARISQPALVGLRALAAEISAVTADMTRFSDVWRRVAGAALGGTGNPALTVVGEILQWARLGTRPAVNAGSDDPWAAIAPRLAPMFAELVDALAARDPAAARACWATLLELNLPFVESHGFAHRLIVDVVE